MVLLYSVLPLYISVRGFHSTILPLVPSPAGVPTFFDVADVLNKAKNSAILLIPYPGETAAL